MSRFEIQDVEMYFIGLLEPVGISVELTFEDTETHHLIRINGYPSVCVNNFGDYDYWSRHFHQSIEDAKRILEGEVS